MQPRTECTLNTMDGPPAPGRWSYTKPDSNLARLSTTVQLPVTPPTRLEVRHKWQHPPGRKLVQRRPQRPQVACGACVGRAPCEHLRRRVLWREAKARNKVVQVAAPALAQRAVVSQLEARRQRRQRVARRPTAAATADKRGAKGLGTLGADGRCQRFRAKCGCRGHSGGKRQWRRLQERSVKSRVGALRCAAGGCGGGHGRGHADAARADEHIGGLDVPVQQARGVDGVEAENEVTSGGAQQRARQARGVGAAQQCSSVTAVAELLPRRRRQLAAARSAGQRRAGIVERSHHGLLQTGEIRTLTNESWKGHTMDCYRQVKYECRQMNRGKVTPWIATDRQMKDCYRQVKYECRQMKDCCRQVKYERRQLKDCCRRAKGDVDTERNGCRQQRAAAGSACLRAYTALPLSCLGQRCSSPEPLPQPARDNQVVQVTPINPCPERPQPMPK
eukprot:350563-Chlamydomonas_euryale.AAC.2